MIKAFLSIFLACFIVPSFAAKPVVLTLRLLNNFNETEIRLGLNQATDYKAFTLNNPTRLVLDLPGTQLGFHLPTHINNTFIRKIRSGHPIPKTLRLVFDLTQAVQYRAYFRPEEKQFVLVLVPQTTQAKPPEKKLTVTVQPKMLPKQRPIIVVIDAGHGGKDVGAIGNGGAEEKNIVLIIARNLAHFINQQPGMRAELTRSGDYFVPLRDRLRLARKGKGDLFISIHADSYFNNTASGASIYALSRRGATSEAAHWIAKRENTSELGGVNLAELDRHNYILRSVLIDLAQTATITDSLRLGKTLLASLDDVTTLHYARVEQAPFVVLKSPDIPSVLVELGFISNPNEEKRLRDPRYQHKITHALFTGLRNYIKLYPPT